MPVNITHYRVFTLSVSLILILVSDAKNCLKLIECIRWQLLFAVLSRHVEETPELPLSSVETAIDWHLSPVVKLYLLPLTAVIRHVLLTADKFRVNNAWTWIVRLLNYLQISYDFHVRFEYANADNPTTGKCVWNTYYLLKFLIIACVSTAYTREK